MAKMIDVLEILAAQHREVDALIERLEEVDGDRAPLFFELADRLAAHVAVEERLFYPAATFDDTRDQLHEAVEDHLAMKRLLTDMLRLDADDDLDEFEAKLAVLKDQVAHHAHDEEEGKLFPKLRRRLSADERAALGREVLAMFEALLGSEPQHDVPAEPADAAQLRDA